MEVKNQTTPGPITPELPLGKASKAQQAEKVRHTRAPSEVEKADNENSHDKGYNVALSSESRNLQEARAKAYEIARQTPDVREDRVREIKERIKNGTYEVDSGKIADGMLREAIKERLSESGS